MAHINPQKLCPIPTNDNRLDDYYISHYGDVFDNANKVYITLRVDEFGHRFVRIGNTEYFVDRLLVWSMIGYTNFDITYSKHRLGFDSKPNSMNLSYALDTIEILENYKETGQTDYLINNALVVRSIPNCDRYAISQDGIVVNIAAKKFMHRVWRKDGYAMLFVTTNDGDKIPIVIHRTIWETWNGKITGDLVVDHKDDVRFHNHLSNFQLLTRGENIAKGHKNHKRFRTDGYSEDQIHDFCRRMERGETNEAIARAHNLPFETRNERAAVSHVLSRLVNGVTFPEIGEKYDFSKRTESLNHPRRSLTEDQVRDIWSMLKQHTPITEIAQTIGTSYGAVRSIACKATWKKFTDKLDQEESNS